MRPIDFGAAVVGLRLGRWSGLGRVREAVVCVVLAFLVVAIGIAALCMGELPLSPSEVAHALLGADDGLAGTVVREWRLPRLLGAIVFGFALGLAGAILQSLTRNPLASPDVVGVSSGAYAGGLFAIILLDAGFALTATGALIGGLLTAVAVYLLAYVRGVQGFRLIIVGIGVGAMLSALSTYLMLRASLEVAMTATAWGAGSLTPVGWSQLVPVAVLVGLLLVPIGLMAQPLRQMELGDDAARALGVSVERARFVLLVGAVALTALVTAVTGPIAFVALAAPQIARRLTAGAQVPLAAAGLLGALLLTVSDVVAQHALPVPVPVGIVTVVIGGAYLLWLLIHEARRTA